MPAFVEKLCEHVGIVRVGPHAHKYGDPYRWAVTYLLENGYAVLKGYADAGFSAAEYREAITAINDAEGKLVAYDRSKDKTSRTVFQVSPTQTQGKIIMHKVTDAIKPDGTIDHAEVARGAAYWMGELQKGTHAIRKGGEADIGNGDTLIWFIRHKN
jgi:hypothetical protein